MTNTVTRLMAKVHAIENLAALAADPMNSESEQAEYVNELVDKRQALQDELTRLFTPLSPEQIQGAATLAVKRKELNWAGFSEDGYGSYTIPVLSTSHIKLIRVMEKAHGIGGES